MTTNLLYPGMFLKEEERRKRKRRTCSLKPLEACYSFGGCCNVSVLVIASSLKLILNLPFFFFCETQNRDTEPKVSYTVIFHTGLQTRFISIL